MIPLPFGLDMTKAERAATAVDALQEELSRFVCPAPMADDIAQGPEGVDRQVVQGPEVPLPACEGLADQDFGAGQVAASLGDQPQKVPRPESGLVFGPQGGRRDARPVPPTARPRRDDRGG